MAELNDDDDDDDVDSRCRRHNNDFRWYGKFIEAALRCVYSDTCNQITSLELPHRHLTMCVSVSVGSREYHVL